MENVVVRGNPLSEGYMYDWSCARLETKLALPFFQDFERSLLACHRALGDSCILDTVRVMDSHGFCKWGWYECYPWDNPVAGGALFRDVPMAGQSPGFPYQWIEGHVVPSTAGGMLVEFRVVARPPDGEDSEEMRSDFFSVRDLEVAANAQ